MSVSLRGLATALAASLICATAPACAAPTLCDAGPPIGIGPSLQLWHGDFDGDGTPDRLWLLTPGQASAVADHPDDPWSGLRRRFEPGLLTIVIAHGRQCSLIQKARFFATPIWDDADKPLRVLLRSDAAIKEWPSFQRRGKGDGVLLGTEAGPDVLLYRDARRWRIEQGREAP